MRKIKYGHLGNGLTFWDDKYKTIAHFGRSGLKYYNNPGAGIKQKINKICLAFEDMGKYGTLTKKGA
tara:strand:- start:604 stop:804 length:201 start_codon:yes stop_codon:yes gene_type:complete